MSINSYISLYILYYLIFSIFFFLQRGIEESVVNAVNGASATTTTNGASGVSASTGVLLADSPTTPMLVDVNGTAVGGAATMAAYAHLNGVIDSSVVAMMPDSKKIKVDHGDDAGGSGNATASITTVVGGGSGGGKSRVVHLRNIPNDTSVSDLYQLASPFGAITKHILVKSKHQAFVEFESPFGALQMTNYWLQTSIGGVPSPVQPSIRYVNTFFRPLLD